VPPNADVDGAAGLAFSALLCSAGLAGLAKLDRPPPPLPLLSAPKPDDEDPERAPKPEALKASFDVCVCKVGGFVSAVNEVDVVVGAAVVGAAAVGSAASCSYVLVNACSQKTSRAYFGLGGFLFVLLVVDNSLLRALEVRMGYIRILLLSHSHILLA